MYNLYYFFVTEKAFLKMSFNWVLFIVLYSILYISLASIHHLRIYYELSKQPVPSWLDGSVGRALHRHRRGHEFQSRSSLNFFRLSLRSWSSCEQHSDCLSLINSSICIDIWLPVLHFHRYPFQAKMCERNTLLQLGMFFNFGRSFTYLRMRDYVASTRYLNLFWHTLLDDVYKSHWLCPVLIEFNNLFEWTSRRTLSNTVAKKKKKKNGGNKPQDNHNPTGKTVNYTFYSLWRRPVPKKA